MAVVNENSAQLTNSLKKNPPEAVPVHEWRARKRAMYFKHTQAVAGDATSIQGLVQLPQGKVRVIAAESRIYFSAFGAARTLDVGFAAHKKDSDGSAVVADPDFFATAVDVSAAGVLLLDEAAAAGPSDVRNHLFESQDSVRVISTVAGGTIPAGAVLEGVITYVLD